MVFPEGGGGGKGEGSKIPGNMAREGTLVARQDKCVAACCQNGCGQEKGGAGGLVERGEWQIIGWVHNMQFAHARVSKKVEKSCVEVWFEDMIGITSNSESSDKQQKKRPWHIFKHQSIGKDYAGDQKMANPKKAQFNQIVTRKCQI